MEPVLYYAGQELGLYLTNVPRRDLTAQDIEDIARARDCSPEQVVDWLLDTGAWQETPVEPAQAPEPPPTTETPLTTVAAVETVQAEEASRPRRQRA